MSTRFIVIGAGGHAKVLVDALKAQSVDVFGLTDIDPAKVGSQVLGCPVLGDDKIISGYSSDSVKLVNGLGSVHVENLRRRVFEDLKKNGYSFATVLHPTVIVGSEVVLSEGAQIMAGVILQAGSRIGVNTIVNTGARVDHDCIVGSHVHIGPGVTLSGGVVIENGAHIGTGATVIQGVKIEQNALIAAGAVVTKDVQANAKVAGVPAREF